MSGLSTSRRWPGQLAVAVGVVLGVVAVLAVLTAARLALVGDAGWSELIEENEATNAILGVTFGVLGALAVANRPGNALSWLFVVEGQSNAWAVLTSRWVGYAGASGPDSGVTELAAVVAANVWIPGFVLAVTVLPLIFPSGRWLSQSWRWPGRAAVIVTAASGALAFTSDVPLSQSCPGQHNPLAVFPWSASIRPFIVLVVLTIGLAVVGLACLVLRFRRGDRIVRAQVGWLLLALVVNLAVSPLPSEVPGLIGSVLIAAALSLAVIRYRLYDIDRLLTRTTVYLVLTAGVIAVFAASAWVLGSRLDRGVLGWVLGGSVVVLGIGPAREALQRGVDRLMYGRGRSPYDALAGIGRRLEHPGSSASLLAEVVAAVAETLRYPHVAVILAGEEEPVAAAGVLDGPVVAVPLAHADRAVGRLDVGLRRGESRLSPRDQALLGDIAHLVAAAAQEHALSADLHRSRERLVLARDEERRRLRRELHDGLGPGLAGLSLGVGAAARAAARGDIAAASTLLAGAQIDIDGLLSDVRRISRDLTPAALDELGLQGALGLRAAATTEASDGALLVRVQSEELPELPGAVAVAAYRIVTEALTNTLRHADASQCTVRLVADAELHLEVRDDGRGVPAESTPGIGLRSMAERAAELGGQVSIDAGAHGGTVVSARLPLAVHR